MSIKIDYLTRARKIQEIVAQHYEPERKDKNLRAVYSRYVADEFGITYKSFLKAYHADTSALEELKERRKKERGY